MGDEQLAEVQAKLAAVEAKLEASERRVRDLEREVPLGVRGLKSGRLGLEPREMMAKDGQEAVKWPAYKVRETFIKFFEEKYGHKFWRSSPVVPHNDPTLLFTNAGMNQYKPLFLGQADPNTEMATLTRACNTQKCIRAGGKHNDLEDVGKDVYHHTFFEMLGNWSFGDYFKQEAIDWSWELLTEVFGLPKDQLYVTYFEGNDQVPADDEARDMWLKYLPADRILPFDVKDNFWEMGDTGPCGPCSEIHFDRIGGRDAASLVNMDDPDVVEIWNLVFMQFNRKPGGVLERLPNAHIDTGMGFERLVSALQEKTSNYDTDVFMPLFEAIHKMADVPPYAGKVGEADTDNVDMAYRVVADHIRTLSFAIADGAFPSNEGRGYVLRRVLRRAVRYGQEVLKMPIGSFAKLVAVLVELMKDIFPELGEKESLIYEVILDEEETFARTLDRGIARFRKEADKIKAAGGTEVPGSVAFFLFEAMGFPVDLTELMAEERGLTLDMAGFEQRLAEHVERSRAARGAGAGEGEGVRKFEAKETTYLAEDLKLAPTDHSSVYVWHEDVEGATVQAIFDSEADTFVDAIELVEGSTKQYGVVLDRTNFYYESGGQLADTGMLVLEADPSMVLVVQDCKSSAGFIVHAGAPQRVEADDAEPGAEQRSGIKIGDKVRCKVDFARRGDLAKNHTCTHLLNFALRKCVSKDVDQKGSLVTDSKLRFDFNSQKPVPLESLINVEKIVRAEIAAARQVHTKVVPLADAMRISSLRAVFGETYPDPVRVVTVGPSVDDVVADPLNEKWHDFSVELCGGTHLSKSSEARAFSLVSESALAKGIRRVICLTGDAAFQAASTAEALRSRVEATAGMTGKALEEEQKRLQEDISQATISVSDKHHLLVEVERVTRRLLDQQKAAYAKVSSAALEAVASAQAAGKPFFIYRVAEPGTLAPKLGGEIVKKTKKNPISVFLAQGNPEDGTVLYFAAVAKSAQSKLAAKAWVEAAMPGVDVQGGGSPAIFNGKAANLDSLDDVLVKATDAATAALA